MTRNLVRAMLFATLLSAFSQTKNLAEESLIPPPLPREELTPIALAVNAPVNSFSEFNQSDEWALASHRMQSELDLSRSAPTTGSSHRFEAAEHLGNWLVVAALGLSFTVGLIITISMAQPTTKQPRPVF